MRRCERRLRRGMALRSCGSQPQVAGGGIRAAGGRRMRRCERRLRRGERIIVAAARSRRFPVEEYGQLEGEDAPLRAAPTEGADYRSCGSQPQVAGGGIRAAGGRRMRRCERRLRRGRIIVAAARSRRFLVGECGQLEGEGCAAASGAYWVFVISSTERKASITALTGNRITYWVFVISSTERKELVHE